MDKAKIMAKIWDKYNKANHNTSGYTRAAIFPRTDADWFRTSKTYSIKYKVPKDIDVMTDIVINLNMVVAEDHKAVVSVLNQNFKKTPKFGSVAKENVMDWVKAKMTEPQYVKYVNKKTGKVTTYWYPAEKRVKSIAFRVMQKIKGEGKIQNRSGFLQPFQRKSGLVDKAINKGVSRWVIRWDNDVNDVVLKKATLF